MPVLRNVNPLGAVDLPLIWRQGEPFGQTGSGCLEPDEEFETSPDHARILLAQIGNYSPVDAEALAINAEVHGDPEATPDKPVRKAPAKKSDAKNDGGDI